VGGRRPQDPSGHAHHHASLDSPRYTDPVTVAADVNQPLPDPPPGTATITVDFSTVRAARRFVTEQADRVGLAVEQTP
jgi:hypothetical protein